MISSGGNRGNPLNVNATTSVGGGQSSRFLEALGRLSSNDQSAATQIEAMIAQSPALGKLFGGGGGPRTAARDPFSGRFIGQRSPPIPQLSGAISARTETFYRDSHQMAVDIHRLVASNLSYSHQPVPSYMGGFRPNTQGMVLPGSVPSAGALYRMPPPGPWGARGGGGAPPAGGGGGGGRGGGGGFWNWATTPRGGGGGWGGVGPGAVGAGAGFLGHYGILRGFLVGEIAGEAGDLIKDILLPGRPQTEMYTAFRDAINPFVSAAKGYYALGTTGGFSGADLMDRFNHRKNKLGFPGEEWMRTYGVTNDEILNNYRQFGLLAPDVDTNDRIAMNLAVGQRLPGFSNLDPGISTGLARQAGSYGMESTEGATDRYLRKMAEYGVRWTSQGMDSAQVFKNLSGSLDAIARSGAVNEGGFSVANLFDRLASSGLPGARSGDLTAQMVGGATAANNMLGRDSFKNAWVAIALQQRGGFNADAVESLLGPDVMQAINGRGGQVFQTIMSDMQSGDFPGAFRDIGVALNSYGGGTRGADVFNETLRRQGVPAGTAALAGEAQYGTPYSVGRGFVGTGANTGAGAALLSSLGVRPGSAEWLIAMRESRGRPNVGWEGMPGSPDYSPQGTDLSGVPLDAYGFPDWKGKMGPAGISTAAGIWQITKTNWHKYAPLLGIHDFSPKSQMAVERAMVRARHGYGDWAASGRVYPYDPDAAAPPDMSDTASGSSSGPLSAWAKQYAKITGHLLSPYPAVGAPSDYSVFDTRSARGSTDSSFGNAWGAFARSTSEAKEQSSGGSNVQQGTGIQIVPGAAAASQADAANIAQGAANLYTFSGAVDTAGKALEAFAANIASVSKRLEAQTSGGASTGVGPKAGTTKTDYYQQP